MIYKIYTLRVTETVCKFCIKETRKKHIQIGHNF